MLPCTKNTKKEELIRAWVEAENRLDGGGEIARPEVVPISVYGVSYSMANSECDTGQLSQILDPQKSCGMPFRST